ncbi:MAG: hypothetical protein PF904_07845 [Kiritimatiellae bacterium]|jgi:hypothetical protein|nr:hypothetical protein [Kiritimatiellia bacterium]
MLKTIIFTLSAVTSALICGFSLTTLIAASLTPCAFLWIKALITIKTPCGYVINDPANYNPIILSEALENAVKESIHSQKPLVLQISNPGINIMQIEINQQGELQVCDSRRSIKIKNNAEVWIPNHPLPLKLYAENHLTLLFSPLNDGRISVSTSLCPAMKGVTPLWLLPLALFFIFDINAAAAALLAPLFQAILMRRFDDSLQ